MLKNFKKNIMFFALYAGTTKKKKKIDMEISNILL